MVNKFLIIHGEDDAVDVRILREILASMDYAGEYKNITLGQEFLDYMLFRGAYNGANHRLPNLIILDIGLPGFDGKEILATLRAEKNTQSIPVIMSSGSCSLRDYQQCILMGANAYVQKSSDYENFSQTFKLFIEGWQRLGQQNFF